MGLHGCKQKYIFRSANNVLKSQSKNISSKNYISNYMKEIQKLGYISYEAIINKDYDEFGKILDIHYNYKRKISKMMSNSVLDNLYEFGINAGALGGKTIGAPIVLPPSAPALMPNSYKLSKTEFDIIFDIFLL